MEVAEHIDGAANDRIATAMFDSLAPEGVLIWTAAKPGQGGVGHINCQTKYYWIEKLNATGLKRDLELENKLIAFTKDGYHMGWFVQNLLVYRKTVQ